MGRDYSPLFDRMLLCLLSRGPLAFKERELDSFDSKKKRIKNVSHTHADNSSQGYMSEREILNEACFPAFFFFFY